MRQVRPDSLQQLCAGQGRPSPIVGVAADLAFEVHREAWIVLIRQPGLQHLPADQGQAIGLPEQARNFSGTHTDRIEIQKCGDAFSGSGEGHHGRGAAQVNRQGSAGG